MTSEALTGWGAEDADDGDYDDLPESDERSLLSQRGHGAHPQVSTNKAALSSAFREQGQWTFAKKAGDWLSNTRRRTRRRRSRRRRSRRRIPDHLRPRTLYFEMQSNAEFSAHIEREAEMLKGSEKPLKGLEKEMTSIEARELPKSEKELKTANSLVKAQDTVVKDLVAGAAASLKHQSETIATAVRLSRLALEMSKATIKESSSSIKGAVNAESKSRMAKAQGTKDTRKAVSAMRLSRKTKRYDNVAFREAALSEKEASATNKESGAAIASSRRFEGVAQRAVQQAEFT